MEHGAAIAPDRVECGGASKRAPAIEFRYLDNQQNPELQEELRINGAEEVPVVVVLSEDFSR